MKNASRSVRDSHQKNCVKLMDKLTGRYSKWEVWSDFITMTAITFSNAVDKANAPEREQMFKRISGKYCSEEQNLFAQMLGEIIMGLEDDSDQDLLGNLYMVLELGNNQAGQFFTPYSVSKCIAEMQMTDVALRLEQEDWISVSDPACGAGALLIAFANPCIQHGINYQNKVLFVAQDIDYIVGMMCYIQLSLLGCAGYVVIGNTLLHPTASADKRGLIPTHSNSIWYTPFYFREERSKFMDKQIVYLPVSQLHPHPDNPRKEIGDLTELAESIRASGILQNLTVIKNYGETGNWDESYGYKVIIGHRRLEASKLAELETVPCVIIEITEKEQLSTMLVENMQRSDLTVFEQAQGFQMMLNLGSTVEQIAKESGFSVFTVRRRIKMTELDQAVLKEVSSRQLSLGDFDKLAQIENLEERNRCLSKIGTSDFNQAVTREIRVQEIKRKRPIVMQDLKNANVQIIECCDTYSGKYTPIGNSTYVQEWSEKSVIPDSKGKSVYASISQSWGDIQFWIKASKSKTVKAKKTQEQIDEEIRLAEVWKRTAELNEETRQLR